MKPVLPTSGARRMITGMNAIAAAPNFSLPGFFSLSDHRASRLQPIRSLPVFRPMLIRVAYGTKRIFRGDETDDVRCGQMIALPARIEISLTNVPDERGYLAQMLGIAPEVIVRFREKHADLVNRLLAEKFTSLTPFNPHSALDQAWQHLQSLRLEPAQAEIALHRLEEVLLGLVLQGAGHSLFLDRHDAWSERVRLLLQLEPARKWQAVDLAERLHCSESTLRRHLAREDCALRELLDAIRMNTGLNLVLGSSRQIAEIALACGYDSASRFSIRFRQRFGQSPSEMRATR